MKRLVILTCLLTIGFSAYSNNPGRGINHNCIHVISMANDAFYFKSDSDVDGANVDVYEYKTGEKKISQVIEGKKTVIDMSGQASGDYIILITKGDFKRKYVFHKK